MIRLIGKPVKFENELYTFYTKLLQLFGIIVFAKPQGVPKTSNWLVFFVWVRIIFYLGFSIFNLHLITNNDDTILIKTTDVILGIASAFYAVCSWVYILMRTEKHIELYLKIGAFDKKLRQLHTSVNYDRHVRFLKIEGIIRVVHIVIPTVGQIIEINHRQGYEQLCFTILFSGIAIVNTLFSHMITNYIKQIKDRFAVLNALLSQLLSETDINTVENSVFKQKYGSPLLLLSNVCHLHHYLTKLVKLVNHIFGFNLVVLFAVGFINIVIGLFYCSYAIQSFDANWRKVVANLLSAIFYATDILYICHQGQYTIDEAKKAGLLIHKIETSDYDIKDEIEMFSLQIANEKVEFNAAGFFPVNYTLVFSIIGGVTTYLIILIQLAANKSINSKTSN